MVVLEVFYPVVIAGNITVSSANMMTTSLRCGWMDVLFIADYFLLPKTYCYPGIMRLNILTTSNWFAPPSRTSLPLLLIIFLLFIKTSHKTHRQKLPSRIFFPWLQILFFPLQNVQHVLHTFSAIASELQRISTFSVLNLHGDGLSFSPTLHFLIHSLFLFPSTRPSLAAYFTCLLLNNSALNIYLSNLFSILSSRGAADS